MADESSSTQTPIDEPGPAEVEAPAGGPTPGGADILAALPPPVAVEAPPPGPPPTPEPPVRLRGALVMVLAAVAFIWIYFFQYYERIPNPNEQTRAYLTIALVERGTIGIDAEIRKYGDTIDKAEFRGRTLCDKAPGLSFIGAPVYAFHRGAAKLAGHEPTFSEILKVLRVFSVALPSLLLLLLIFWGLGLIDADDRVRLPILAVYALGTTVHTYSVLLFSHALAAGLAAGAFFLLVRLRGGGPAWHALAAGLLAGCAVISEYPLLIAALVLTGYLLATSWRRPGAVALFALGALVPALLLLAYNKAAFGGWFQLGYAHIANPHFAQFHKDGALGVTVPKLNAFGGSFFSASRGYFPFQPWLLLAFPGLFWLFKRRALRAEGVAVVAAIAGYAYFISSFSYWQAGGTVSQRHLTALTPFLLVPLAVFARAVRAPDMRPLRLLWAAAGLFSIGVITACTVPFPFFSTAYPNPLYELALRLWHAGLLPYSLGRSLGLRGLWAAVPYALAVAAVAALFLRLVVEAEEGHWRRRGLVLAAVAIVAVVAGAYSLVERERNLEIKTNDLWGIVTNYEPREGRCDLETRRTGAGKYAREPDTHTAACEALLGHTGEALDIFRDRGK